MKSVIELTKVDFIRKACEELKLDSWVYLYDGKPFLIVEGWEEMNKIEKYLRKNTSFDNDFAELSEYSTECVDFCMDDNWGFSDEYSTCHDCNGVVKTSADSYSWTPKYWVSPYGGLYCLDCVDMEEYFDNLRNNPDDANTLYSNSELEKAGYEKINDYYYENGWYGTTNNPKRILKEKLSQYPDGEFIFSICNQEQFRTCFDVWRRV